MCAYAYYTLISFKRTASCVVLFFVFYCICIFIVVSVSNKIMFLYLYAKLNMKLIRISVLGYVGTIHIIYVISFS